MEIERKNKVTRTISIVCAVAAILDLLLLFRSFSAYLLFMAFVNALLSFVLYRGTGKDRECLIGIFAALTLHSVYQVFAANSLTAIGGLLLFLRIGGYAAILAFLLAIVSDKKVPIAGACAVVLANLWNSYQLIMSFRNLGAMLGSYGGGLSSKIILTLFLSILTMLTYSVPVVVTAVLIAANAIQIQNAKGGAPMQNPEKEAQDVQESESTTIDNPAEESGSNQSQTKISTPKLSTISKKTKIIAGIAAVALIALIVVLRTVSSPINKFNRALSSGDFALAQQLYSSNLQDGKFADAADQKLLGYLDSVKETYINDNSTFDEAQESALAVDDMIPVQDTLDALKVISDSKAALQSAETAEQDGDFYSAIEAYGKIDPIDTKDYATVDERISTAKSSLVAKALADATAAVQAGNYSTAIATLATVQESGYATPEIDTAILDSANAMVAACKTPSDYYAAYDQLKKIEQDGIDQLMTQVISASSVATVSEAETLIAQQKYMDAFKVLSTPKGDFVTSEIESALSKCAGLASDAILAEVENLKANSQYKEAYELLKDVDGALLTDSVKSAKSECENLYKNAVLDSAAQLAAQGDYDGAIAAINEGQRLLDAQELKDKADEYRLEKLKSEQLITVERTRVERSFLYSQAYVTVKNNTDKVVKEYVVAMIMLDSNGYPVNNSHSFDNYHGYANVHAGRADSVNIQPGGTYGNSSYWLIEGSCRKTMACVVSAEFYDGTTWNNPYFDPWVKFYAERPVN